MKRSSIRSAFTVPFAISFALMAASLLVITGCGGDRGPTRGHLFQIPWPNESGKYSLQKVEITSFTNPASLSGRFAMVMVDPHLDNGRLASSTPIGRYIRNSDGVNVPADYITLQATSVQAHFQRLAELDKRVGVQLKWPFTIGIQANVVNEQGALNNNALFDKGLDALLIVPYTAKDLPIALNAGILAHEHFHQVFESVVLSPLAKIVPSFDKTKRAAHDWKELLTSQTRVRTLGACLGVSNAAEVSPLIYNEFILRAMNEGLADFWGWVYTGDSHFIEPSLPAENRFRKLDVTVLQLPYQSKIKDLLRRGDDCSRLHDEGARVSLAYMVGSDYSRILRELTLSLSQQKQKGGARIEVQSEVREQMARALIGSLPELAKLAAAAGDRQPLSASAFMKPLFEQLKAQVSNLSPETCSIFERATAGDGEERVSFCSPRQTLSSWPKPTVRFKNVNVKESPAETSSEGEGNQ